MLSDFLHNKMKKEQRLSPTLPNGQELHSGEIIPQEVLTAQNSRFAQFDTTKDANNEGLDFREFSEMYRDEIYEELTGFKPLRPSISDGIKSTFQPRNLDTKG